MLGVRGGDPVSGWVPPSAQIAALGDRWVHGLDLPSMEAFEAACRLRSRSVLVLAREPRAAIPRRRVSPIPSEALVSEQRAALRTAAQEIVRRQMPPSHVKHYTLDVEEQRGDPRVAQQACDVSNVSNVCDICNVSNDPCVGGRV